MSIPPENLAPMMPLGRVIRVHVDGVVSDASNVAAPQVYDDGETHMRNEQWSLLANWPGAGAEAGPILGHATTIHGSLAEHILRTPGLHAAVPVVDAGDPDGLPVGWAIAYQTED